MNLELNFIKMKFIYTHYTFHFPIACTHNQLKLEISCLTLFEEQVSTFTQGDIGLGAATYADDNTPAEVHFDNLVVTAP